MSSSRASSDDHLGQNTSSPSARSGEWVIGPH